MQPKSFVRAFGLNGSSVIKQPLEDLTKGTMSAVEICSEFEHLLYTLKCRYLNIRNPNVELGIMPKSELLVVRVSARSDFRRSGLNEHAKSVQKPNVRFLDITIQNPNKIVWISDNWVLIAQTESLCPKTERSVPFGLMDIPFSDRNFNSKFCLDKILPCRTSPGAPFSYKIWTTFSGLMEALVFFPPNQLLVMTNSSQSFHW